MPAQTTGSYEFGAFRLDADARVVSRGGQVLPLAPKTFDLLRLLTQAPGRAFSKRELMTALWPDTVVEEANLSFQISILRKALGDEGAKRIETVPRYGYRFAGDVRAVAREGPPDEMSFDDAHSLRVVAARRRRAASVWVVAVAAAAVLLAAALAVLSRRSHGGDAGKAAAPVSVPLTAYPGIEQMPTLSPDGSQVAFSWDGRTQDNADIYVKLVGTGEPIRLTTHQGPDDSPAWSPDGLSIAFRRHRSGLGSEVFVMPALAGAERKVLSVESDGTPSHARANLAWTPDGEWIAVGGRPLLEKATGIWLVAADGSSKRPLTEIGELDWGDTTPTFSPDGRYLAFIRARRGLAGAVYVLPLSATWAPAGRPVPVTAEFGNVSGLAWAPDGGSLIFSAGGHVGITRLQRVTFTPTQQKAGRSDILPFGERAGAVSISGNGRLVYSSDTRDSSLWRLPLPASGQPVPGLIAPSTYDEHTPDYSPDGKRLAFASTRSGDEEIWISDADGSNPVQMTFMKGPLCANPRWAPDGTRILFTSRREGSQDLYLMVPDTGDVRRFTDDPAEEAEARWSRDGRRIYFGSNRTGRPEVWRMPAAGGPATQVTHGGGLTASESPDGRFLYYAKNLASPTSIWRVRVDGGEERLVTEGLSYSLNFVTADRGLYFLAVGDAPHKTSIDFLEYATGKRTTLFTVGKAWWAGMAIAPDQRSLLYSVIESQGSNLMLVESFH